MHRGTAYDAGDQAYLTIVSLPNGGRGDDVAAPLALATRIDLPTMKLECRKEPPCIVALLPRQSAEAGAAAMIDAGGDAFVAAMAEIEALGPTNKIKDLAIENGRLKLDLWRGPAVTVDPADLQVVVRAKLSETTAQSGPRVPQYAETAAALALSGFAGSQLGWGMGGAYGWAAMMRATANMQHFGAMDRRVTVSHKLDFHTATGAVFQIDGDKFGYKVLGDQRGHSDNVNIDRMCELLTHLAPEVVVDPYFSLWHPPNAYKRISLPMMRLNDEDPAFAFYSRWATLMYRHVMGEATERLSD